MNSVKELPKAKVRIKLLKQSPHARSSIDGSRSRIPLKCPWKVSMQTLSRDGVLAKPISRKNLRRGRCELQPQLVPVPHRRTVGNPPTWIRGASQYCDANRPLPPRRPKNRIVETPNGSGRGRSEEMGEGEVNRCGRGLSQNRPRLLFRSKGTMIEYVRISLVVVTADNK